MRILPLLVFFCGTTSTPPERPPGPEIPVRLATEAPSGAPGEGSAASRRVLRELKEARLKLKRTQLDQSLIRSERTAHMLAELESYGSGATEGGRP